MNLTTEAGKRRFLAEAQAIALYNKDKEDAFRITMQHGLGTAIVAEVGLKPTHNFYRIRAELHEAYPASPPRIWFVEPDQFPTGVPHLLGGNRPCLFPHTASGDPSYVKESWNPATHTLVFAILATWRWCLAFDYYVSTGRWIVDSY